MHSHKGQKVEKTAIAQVLILVLMEDALALWYRVQFEWMSLVLILVLMEDALAR